MGEQKITFQPNGSAFIRWTMRAFGKLALLLLVIQFSTPFSYLELVLNDFAVAHVTRDHVESNPKVIMSIMDESEKYRYEMFTDWTPWYDEAQKVGIQAIDIAEKRETVDAMKGWMNK